MIEMIIDSLRAGLINPNMPQRGTPYIVMLKEKDADLYLPIFIGQSEAHVIALKLNKEELPRPLSHDLMRACIESLGGTLNSVVICDVRNETFFAKLIINAPQYGQIEIDSRPSDAIALALACSDNSLIPIYAEESVLEKAGIPVDRDGMSPNLPGNRIITNDPGAMRRPSNPAPNNDRAEMRKTSEDELGKLSAYSDFLDSLNLDDFGQSNS